ncbi:hypothetical protein BEL04_22295 [Mucilaginibacter sp. PPCGB 2223]|uniref:DUF2752 domain-containing protein n=1 Tax=Mucilaginibacter sp. PPCGB 2223 TaxID=1886027 RepID=UPI00082560FB|nr:DUF2752 domain-containing protein [Mucilaginibacter sp. PPCGB 2223]OCX50510.1 hypothetical protein BEL04_22295 [Mucilaginibacter sp. PPCGB 2223]
MIKALSRNFELIFWVAALLCLSLASPSSNTHFTLCPLKLMGFGWCPGCGLGHSIIYLFHGQVSASLHAHWLGIPAVVVIFYRITQLFSKVFVTFS